MVAWLLGCSPAVCIPVRVGEWFINRTPPASQPSSDQFRRDCVGGLTRERAAGCSRFCQERETEMRRGFLKGFSFSATAEGWHRRKMDGGATFCVCSLLCPPQLLVLSFSLCFALAFHPCFVIVSLLISFQLMLLNPPTHHPTQ